MESSSAVLVMDVKRAVRVSSGIGASGAKRQTAKVPGSERNFRRMTVVSRTLNPEDAKPLRAWLGLDGSETRPYTVSGDSYSFSYCCLG
jgi:hypothetical protein